MRTKKKHFYLWVKELVNWKLNYNSNIYTKIGANYAWSCCADNQ